MWLLLPGRNGGLYCLLIKQFLANLSKSRKRGPEGCQHTALLSVTENIHSNYQITFIKLLENSNHKNALVKYAKFNSREVFSTRGHGKLRLS